MRISTAQIFETGVEALQRRQRELAQAQQQLTSGKRVERASDDPAAAARAERALAAIGRSEAAERALEASRTAMTLAEGALGDATDLLQQAREIMVAAGNATYSDAEREALAVQLRGVRAQLFQVANRVDGAGGFVFSGQGSAAPPFVDAPGGVVFTGVPGELQAASGEPLPLTADGRAPWLAAPTGNGVFETRAVPGSRGAWIDAGRVTDPAALTGSTYAIRFSVASGTTTYSVLRDGVATALTDVPYSAGTAIEIDGLGFSVMGVPADGDGHEIAPSEPALSVFDTLDRLAGELATPGRTRAQIAQGNLFGLRDLDASLARLSTVRAEIGETLNRTDGVADRLDATKLAAQTEHATATDLDMVHAISDFSAKQSGYEAALKTYSMVQRLSLFDYLR
jgi:flagellar hook-associated protein 3 FlgL